jgi:amino acid transporter
MFWAVMVVCMLINIFGAKFLDLINKICIYWTSASVIIILVTLLGMTDSKRSGTFVFGHYDASQSGWYAHMFTLLNFVEMTDKLFG